MKKSILNIGTPLNNKTLKEVTGGFINKGGCYLEPQADVNCVSPWIYAHGCWTCLLAPENP